MYFSKFLNQSSHLGLIYMSCEGAEFAQSGDKKGSMEEVLAEKFLFSLVGRYLKHPDRIVTHCVQHHRSLWVSCRSVLWELHLSCCVLTQMYFLLCYSFFFFFKELQISAGFQELSLAERGGRRRDFHDLGVNTRQNLDHVKESKTGRLIIKNKCHEITFQVHRTVN